MQLTSPVFEDGDPIPRKYGYDEDNVNPPLRIEDVPDGARSLALIVDDPDAREPAGKVWDHWVVWNVPPETTEIAEGTSPGEEGRNDFGERGYGGPSPPDGEHTYRFELYALDTELDLPEDTTADDLRAALEGHVEEQDGLTGTYAP